MRHALIASVLTAIALSVLTAPAQAMYRDGMNVYAYVQSAPTTYVDPMGLIGGSFSDGGIEAWRPPVRGVSRYDRLIQKAEKQKKWKPGDYLWPGITSKTTGAVVKGEDVQGSLCECTFTVEQLNARSESAYLPIGHKIGEFMWKEIKTTVTSVASAKAHENGHRKIEAAVYNKYKALLTPKRTCSFGEPQDCVALAKEIETAIASALYDYMDAADKQLDVLTPNTDASVAAVGKAVAKVVVGVAAMKMEDWGCPLDIHLRGPDN